MPIHSSTSPQSLPSELPVSERLRIWRECPLCGSDYAASAVAVLEEQASTQLVHLTCPDCANALLAMVMVSPLGMSSVAVVTDLTAADVKRLRCAAPISADDVLGFYQCLQETEELTQTLAYVLTRH